MVPKDENLRIFQMHVFPSKRGCLQHGEVKGRRNKEEDKDGEQKDGEEEKGRKRREGKKQGRRKAFSKIHQRAQNQNRGRHDEQRETVILLRRHIQHLFPLDHQRRSPPTTVPPFHLPLRHSRRSSRIKGVHHVFVRGHFSPPKKTTRVRVRGKESIMMESMTRQGPWQLVKISRFAMAAEAKKLAG